MENLRTLHPCTHPDFISPKTTGLLGAKLEKDIGKTYVKAFFKISLSLAQGAPEPKISGITKDTRAPKLHLIRLGWANDLGSGNKGIKETQVVCMWSGNHTAAKDMEVDHFHPVNGDTGFMTRMDSLDEALKANDESALKWVASLKEQYPTDDEEIWNWTHFIKLTPEGHYQLTNFFRAAVYNHIDNLWFIDADENTKLQDKPKLPADGALVATSPIGKNPWFGEDFLSKLGQIREGKFFWDRIDDTGLITFSIGFINSESGELSASTKLYGIGKSARNWFIYKYRVANSFGKQLGPIQSAVSEFQRKTEALLQALANQQLSAEEQRAKLIELRTVILPNMLQDSLAE